MNNLSDDILAKLKSEFRDWAQSVLDDLEEQVSGIRRGSPTPQELEEIFLTIAREVHSIKGTSGSYGFGTIANISHRLEDYLGATRDNFQDDVTLQDILVFLDQIRELIALEDDPQGDQALTYLQKLPSASVRGVTEASEKSGKRLEALIISPSKTVAAISTKVFEQCGIHVVRSRTGAEGLSLAIKGRPDIILTSMYLDDISGVDVLRAVSAIAAIRDGLKILSTSLKPDHPELAGLTEEVQIIKSDIAMAEQLKRLAEKVELQ